MRRLVIGVVLIASAACGTTGAGPPPAVSTTSGSTEPAAPPGPFVDDDERWRTTLVRTAEGGRCPDGMCRTEVVVAGDGTWRVTTDHPASGRVQPAEVDDLVGWLLASWSEVTAEPFEEMCPTAYDGQEQTLQLRRIPAGEDAHLRDADVRVTTSCRHAWPEGFVSELDRRWEAAGLPPL